MAREVFFGRVSAVFFDAVGTLLRIRGSVGEAYGRHAVRFGYQWDGSAPLRLDRAFREAFRRRLPVRSLSAGEDLATHEREWWREIVKTTFSALERPFPRFEEYFESLYRLFGTARPYVLEPGCKSVLAELQQSGIRLGVISNFDSRLEDVLEALELRQFFESITIPSQAGFAKPEVPIFRFALNSLQTAAGASVHVGDDVEEDLGGALQSGMRSVLYDPGNRHANLPVVRVRRLRELPSFLL